jgi:MFS family permease
MLKSGLMAGAAMFVIVLIAAIFSPFCALCAPLVVGLGAGYLTGVFEKTPETVVQRGAYAGAIAGGLGIVGQMIASVVNAVVLQNPNNQINPSLGLPIADPAMVWVGQLAVACCVGLVNVALSAGLGAGGGAIWKNSAGKATPPSDATSV